MTRAETVEERLRSLRISDRARTVEERPRLSAASRMGLALAVGIGAGAALVTLRPAAQRASAPVEGDAGAAPQAGPAGLATEATATAAAPASLGRVPRAVLTLGGFVKARRLVQVGSAVSGVVQEVLVRPGDRVRRGQTLAVLANGPLVAQVEQARASLATHDAELEELRNGAQPAELEQADQRVAELASTLEKAELDRDRRRTLADGGLIARQEADNAEYDTRILEARLRATEKDRELLRRGPRPERQKRAEAQLREARAALHLAEAQLAHSVIHSPLDGVVVQLHAEAGELVSAGFGGGAQAALMAVADTSTLIVEVEVPDADLPRIALGRPARIETDALIGRLFEGRLSWISPQANQHSLSVPIEVEVTGDAAGLLPGLSAKVTFEERMP